MKTKKLTLIFKKKRPFFIRTQNLVNFVFAGVVVVAVAARKKLKSSYRKINKFKMIHLT